MISVASQFSEVPGPRLIEEGAFSGEAFLDQQLRPAFLAAESDGATLMIDLDGTQGYATSFLEQAFGGLSREFGSTRVLKVLRFKSDEEPYLVEEITGYIGGADE